MHYRVIRDIGGNSDYRVGSTFDGDALNPDRMRLLVKQRRIEPVGTEEQPTGSDTLAEIEAAMAALADEHARLTAELEQALADRDANPPADPTGGATEPIDPAVALAKHTVPELREMAAAGGIDGHAAMNKTALIAALLLAEARLGSQGGHDGEPSHQG